MVLIALVITEKNLKEKTKKLLNLLFKFLNPKVYLSIY